jgi:hypothetical protein
LPPPSPPASRGCQLSQQAAVCSQSCIFGECFTLGSRPGILKEKPPPLPAKVSLCCFRKEVPRKERLRASASVPTILACTLEWPLAGEPGGSPVFRVGLRGAKAEPGGVTVWPKASVRKGLGVWGGFPTKLCVITSLHLVWREQPRRLLSDRKGLLHLIAPGSLHTMGLLSVLSHCGTQREAVFFSYLKDKLNLCVL